jgi:hypothetical protein
VDPDGRFIWFIASLIFSVAAEYALPTAVTCLEQYAGGAIAGSFLTGLVRGYNGSFFEPSAFGNADLAMTVSERIGMGMGTVFACAPGKFTANASKTALNALSREATNTAIQAVATNGKKCLTWFASSTTRRGTAATVQKTSQTAEKYFVKEVVTEKTTGDWAKLSGILRNTSKEKGISTVGSVTREQADAIGKAWVGEGYSISRSDHALISKDGLRQYRPPSLKPKLGKTQANLQTRYIGQKSKEWQSNAHLDILE